MKTLAEKIAELPKERQERIKAEVLIMLQSLQRAGGR